MSNDETISPNDINFAKKVEDRLYEYAEHYSIETYPSEHRNHLGASSIGESCWRKLWYQFRWVKLQQAEGRMRRLWNRGHREEEVFEQFLLWAGFRKREIHEPFSKVDGHYGGTPDDRYVIAWANDVRVMVDYKTFASKYFEKLKKEKLKVSNPKYYAQLCSYGKEFDVQLGMIFGVNKDNDEWYFELVELNYNYAIELEKKATDIIFATTPPNRISEQAAFWQCKSCTFNGICFYGEKVEMNCRSCINAMPIANGNWHCNEWGKDIPRDAIKDGCPHHRGIV